GQPRDKVSSNDLPPEPAAPHRGPIQVTEVWNWRTGTYRDQRPTVFRSTPGCARPRLPQVCAQAPRHGRRGFVMAPAWLVAPVLVSAVARAPHAPAAYKDRSPRRAAAAASTPATDPRRCRRRRSQSSTKRSCPDAPRTLGLYACARRAADTAHVPGRRDACSARSRAGRAPRPAAAARGLHENQALACCASLRNREEEPVVVRRVSPAQKRSSSKASPLRSMWYTARASRAARIAIVL